MITKFQIKILTTRFQETPLSADKLTAMENLYHFSTSTNVELQSRWFQLALKGHLQSQAEAAIKYAVTQGREKFIRPVYRALYAWEATREMIVEAYKKNVTAMHPITAQTVKKDLHLN